MTKCPTAQSPRAARVLVALSLSVEAAIALRTADAMARALGADLHVYRAIPAARWIDRFRSPRHALPITAAAVATRHFCEVVLRRPLSPASIIVQEGNEVDGSVDAMESLNAALLVIGSGDGASSARRTREIVRRVVRGARRPVLIARPGRGGHAIVAATDLTDPTFPALTHASALGAALRVPITFVHSVDTLMALVAANTFGVGAVLLGGMLQDALASRRAKLQRLAMMLGDDVEPVVLARESAVDAILQVATARDADLIVVGAHKHDALARFSHGTADIVASVAHHSVLAVPVEATQ